MRSFAIRHHAFATALAALALVGLVGCAPADAEGGPTKTPSVPQSLAPSATDVAVGEQNAEELCAAESSSGSDDVCVLEDTQIDGTIVFATQRVVKLIGATVTGSASITGADNVVVTDSAVDGDLEMAGNVDAVVAHNSVGATLTVDGGKHGTIDDNTVDGDLNCTGNGKVEGSGNRVSGTAASQCAPLG
ncbi:hypothetical protein [Paramicrobacterium fandaimingii]|uniref:hypothetical protein n=1 Tax=Paramicrobacterium fandaimingii TaxID=2708079 RepID=UPI00141F46A0|nr:hypothetical protein [Microbacterium fandaimingii]